MSTEDETYGDAAKRLRLERARQAGEIMAEPVLDVRAGTPVTYPIPGTEGPIRTRTAPPKPGPIGRWFGYLFGAVVAGGTLTLAAILFVKAIIWAWGL